MRAAIVIWLLTAVTALAAPAEPPPDDFTGSQYIDTAGCVFVRNGQGWLARLGPEGKPVCGYPPTASARGAGSATGAATAPAAQPITVEQALSETLAAGLRDGELIADDRPREQRQRAPAQTAAAGPLPDLPAMIAAAPELRQAMAGGLQPNDRLCDLLGYDPGAIASSGLGGDSTQGYCGGAHQPDLQPNVLSVVASAPAGREVAAVRPGAAGSGAASSPRPAVTPVAASARAARRGSPGAGHASTRPAGTSARAASAPAPRRAAASPGPEMIPPGARYVVIGEFSDPAAKAATIRRLAALGYPAAHGRATAGHRGAGVLLAGPFADRRSLIAALNDLRARRIGRPVAR